MGSSRSLGELGEVVEGDVIGDPETDIHDVTHDSREAGPGTLFVAIVGQTHDGHDYIDQALSAGASAVCVERPGNRGIPELVVRDTRAALGQLAAEVHGHPSRSLAVVGVTGTNGKTTVTHYVEALLNGAGVRTGLIGTIASRVGDELLPSVRTTPEASDFQRMLAQMRQSGAESVAVEVSSHALALNRIDATRFAVAAFTNLSQDHLDFHGSMTAYREAKERLFSEFEVGTAVLNIDDPVGSAIAGWFEGDVVTVGAGGHFAAEEIEPVPGGTGFTLRAPGGTYEVIAPVFGSFNVSNLAVAIACASLVGPSVRDLVPLLEDLRAVPGRFEIVSQEDEPLVVVDYAHTPDGIRMAVATGREFASGRVIVVFGAGGDRDSAKRPLMGRAASGADRVFVTSDNPRSEDPDAIIDQVTSGITADHAREADRRKAINSAIAEAGPGDVVLILGKGHESGQERAGETVPFDDREVARTALDVLRKSANFGTNSGSIET